MSDGNQPNNWSSFELCRTFDLARNNQFASFQNCPNGFLRLNGINDCFERISKNMNNPSNLLPVLLFARSHSAYISACGAALAGASPESFAMNRLGIEYAGYALLIHAQPNLGEVWLNRGNDKSAVRRAFTVTAIRECIEGVDRKLATIFSNIYDYAIDLGAHPNEMAVTGSMTIAKSGDDRAFAVRYFDERPLMICHAMKSAAEAGLCSLHIFQHILPERFRLLGIREALVPLRENLSKVFQPPLE